MTVEEVLQSWRELSIPDRHEVVKQLSQLLESNEIEKEITEKSKLVSDGIQSEPGNKSTPTNHCFNCGDFNNSDTIELLKKKELFPDLIFTSPPYNSGIDYGFGFDDKKPINDYMDFLYNFIDNCDQVLKDGGRFVINLRDIATGKGQRLPIIVPLYNYICEKKGYTYRGMHLWYKGREENSFAWGSWLKSSSPAIIDLYEYIFVFQKGDYPSGEDNLYKTEFVESVIGVWKIRPVKKFTGKKKKNLVSHPCPFPVELPKRIIKLYSHVGNLVLDPFAGVFSTSCAAVEAGRNSVSIELNRNYCNVGKEKFKKLFLDLFQKTTLQELFA